jgi:hypothetical protein
MWQSWRAYENARKPPRLQIPEISGITGAIGLR